MAVSLILFIASLSLLDIFPSIFFVRLIILTPAQKTNHPWLFQNLTITITSYIIYRPTHTKSSPQTLRHCHTAVPPNSSLFLCSSFSWVCWGWHCFSFSLSSTLLISSMLCHVRLSLWIWDFGTLPTMNLYLPGYPCLSCDTLDI